MSRSARFQLCLLLKLVKPRLNRRIGLTSAPTGTEVECNVSTFAAFLPITLQDIAQRPPLILIAGGPGAGKTVLGRELARHAPSAILVDKDVLGGAWVDAMLHHLNNGHIDRDSKIYWDVVRPLEYSSLLATALDNLALGKTVIAVAPFGPELHDPGWLQRLTESVNAVGGQLRTIWIETDAQTARLRMLMRDNARDSWKLSHWTEFSEKAQFTPPSADLLVLRNVGKMPLPDLVKQAVNYLQLP